MPEPDIDEIKKRLRASAKSWREFTGDPKNAEGPPLSDIEALLDHHDRQATRLSDLNLTLAYMEGAERALREQLAAKHAEIERLEGHYDELHKEWKELTDRRAARTDKPEPPKAGPGRGESDA